MEPLRQQFYVRKPLPSGFLPLPKNPHEGLYDCSGWQTFQNPSSTLRQGEQHLPAENPHLGGKTLHHLQADLGDLADQELCQLMEDLCWEVTLHELNAPPSSPPPMPWGNPAGSGDPGVDDQEVTFLRGGGWVPPGQPFQPPAPIQPDGGWAPQGSPPQPPTPAQPNADLGHLINTLASGLYLGTLRINTFSGKAMPGKTKVSIEQWYHEVQCVKDYYPESVVWENIVRSLKGAVADTARYMGPTPCVSDILQKLMVILGTVASFDVLRQNFYKVTQGNHEKVPSFATRLEGT